MATTTGGELARRIRQNMADLRQACAGIDEATASRAPAGRWSPKEILSHLCGPEGTGLLPFLQAFLDRETPRLDLVSEQTFFSGPRARLTLAQLLAEADKEYEGIAAFAARLSPDQLDRQARVPMLKDSPLGEYPTLGGLLSGLGEYHLRFHIDHLREVVQALSGS